MAAAVQPHLVLHAVGDRGLQAFEQRFEFRHHLDQRAVVGGIRGQPQQPQGGPVHKVDALVVTQSNHPGCDRCQHAVEQPPLVVRDPVAFEQLDPLLLERLGHAVEAEAQRLDFIPGVGHGNAHVQIALAHQFGCRGQPPDRPAEPFREPQTQPDRPCNQQQRKGQIQQRKFKQHPAAGLFQPLVFAHRGAGVVQQPQQAAVHVAGHIKIPVHQPVQPHQRAEFVVLPVLDQQDAVAVHGAELVLRRLFIPEAIAAVAAGADVAGGVDDVSLAQAALDQGLRLGQQAAQRAVVKEGRGTAGVVQHPRQQSGVRGQVAAVFVLIRLGRRQRGRDHLLHPAGKPAFKPDVDGQPGKQRHQHRRHQRQRGKDAHQPHMQPRAGGGGLARGQDRRHPPAHHPGQQQDIDQVGQQDQPQPGAVGLSRQRPHDHIGRHRQHRPQHGKRQRRRVLHTPLSAQPRQFFPWSSRKGVCHHLPPRFDHSPRFPAAVAAALLLRRSYGVLRPL